MHVHGNVDLVQDQVTGTICISKTVSRKNPILVHQMHTEIDCLSSLSMTCIPQIMDCIEYEDSIVLIESYLDGIRLDQWIKEHPFLKFLYRRRFAKEVYAFLEELHQIRYLYVDVKSTNMIVIQHHLYFFDFGSCIPIGSTQVISASTCNYHADMQKKEAKGIEVDRFAWVSFIKFLYPHAWYIKLRFKKAFQLKDKKHTNLYVHFVRMQHCIRIFYVTLCCIGYLIWSSQLSFQQKYERELMHRSDKEILYEWIQEDTIAEQTYHTDPDAYFLMQHALQTEDTDTIRFIENQVPTKIKKKHKKTWIDMLAYCDASYIQNYLDQLMSDQRLSISYIQLLLDKEIIINEKQADMLSNCVHDYQEDTTFMYVYIEYALFLKSQKGPTLYVPSDVQSERYQELYTLWRKVK